MKVYELLAEPTSWTQRSLATNINGLPTDSNADDACKWCLIGALKKCYLDDSEEYWDNFYRLQKKIQFISAWNDDRSRKHEEVVNLCRELDI